MPSNVDFLELYVRNLEFEQEFADGRAIKLSHLLLKQPGARLNADPMLHCLAASVNSLRAYLGSRLTLGTWR